MKNNKPVQDPLVRGKSNEAVPIVINRKVKHIKYEYFRWGVTPEQWEHFLKIEL